MRGLGLYRPKLPLPSWLGSDPQTGGFSSACAANRPVSQADFRAVCCHRDLLVQGLAFVSLPFYFEDILGRSQVETGFFTTPWPLVVAMMAPVAGRLSDRHPAGILGGLGLAAMLLASPNVIDIVWRMAICGCGFGFFQAPNMKALMACAPASPIGSASGVVATARLTGQTIGAALAALCFGLVGREGATLALVHGGAFAVVGCGMSVLCLAATPQSEA
jgi:MFS transporter, DHA2 family, multidrug resistance protein